MTNLIKIYHDPKLSDQEEQDKEAIEAQDFENDLDEWEGIFI